MKRTYSLRFFLVFLISAFMSFSSLYAEDSKNNSPSSNVLFIMDASGSMWGQIDGKAKIDIAKDVMTRLIGELPDQVKSGLEVYGHRKKGDCSDIEILAGVGEKDKKALIQQINGIQPKGKTPITGALDKAAELLKTYEDETTVVLISDGNETCDANPCDRVKTLREQGINVKVHVVGFDVKEDEKKQLSCIAKEGGGKYFSADNADELNAALAEVKEEVAKVESEKNDTIGKIKLFTIFAENTDPIKKYLNYEVYEAKKNLEGNQKKVAFSYKAQPVFDLKEGKYTISVKYGSNGSNARSSIDIDTIALEQAEQTINLNSGFLKFTAHPSADAEAVKKHMSYKVFYAKKDLEGKQKSAAFSHNATPRFALIEGEYSIAIKYGGNESNVSKRIDNVEIKAGETTEQKIDLDFGVLQLSSILAEGQESLKNAFSYKVYSNEKDIEGNRKSQAFSYNAIPKFKLKTGKYHIQIKHGANSSNVITTLDDVEVSAGQLTEKVVNLEAGYLKASTLMDGQVLESGLSYTVREKQSDVEGKQKKSGISYKAKPLFRLKAGDYIISVKKGDKSTEKEITITAGERQEIELAL